MANIITKLSSEHETILRSSFDDLITFGKIFLPGDFLKSKTPAFHYEIADELISPSNKPCAIIVARGHGKSTLIKAKIMHDLCFAKKAKEWGFSDLERNLFFGWVSSSQKKSRNNTAYIKLHLEFNEKINFYFGKRPLGNLKGDVWNQEDLVTAYGDRLVSSSNLTSMRGDTLATLYSGAIRYSGVFIDDAENEDNTRTQQSRDKIVDNIMNGILPAIGKNEPGNRMFFVGTPVHYDSLAQRMLDKWELVQKEGEEAIRDFAWRVFSYPATQPNMPGGVLWNSWMSRSKLDEEKKIYEDTPGKGIEGYYQEFELQVQSYENALWGRKHIKYWDGAYLRRDDMNFITIDGELVPVNTFIGCDPATDIDTKSSDFSVIMAIAVDPNNNVYVLEYERHRAIPTRGLRDENGVIDGKKGVVDYIIELYERYHCENGVVEDVAMNRTVFQDLNQAMRELNFPQISIIPEPPGGRNKINRIYSGLNSRFSSGAVYVRENHFDLINEITKFGAKMAHDDTIETLYYACRYAFPPKGGLTNKYGDYKPKIRKARPWTVA